MSRRPIVHKIMPAGQTLCRDDVPRGSTFDREVTCGTCLKMLATAAEAKALQQIPPDRWP